MNDDPEPISITTYTYQSYDYVSDVNRPGADVAGLAGRTEFCGRPVRPAFAFEHDAAQGVFRLTFEDGTVEVFRDKPVRYLCVEPDETGAMRPVTRYGQPVYLSLSREEREVR